MSKILLVIMGLISNGVMATTNVGAPDLTTHWVGYLGLGIFIVSYIFVIAEEKLHLRKSKPVVMASGLIWLLIGIEFANQGVSHIAEEYIKHNILEYAELFLFLLVAMTYIEAIKERDVFEWLKNWMIRKKLSLKKIFWLTGALAFVISPLADNLTTALIMGAVIMAVGGNNVKFVSISLINIVVAANAGGAFSPFGDITTLMVWQKGMVEFSEFFALLIPSIINWVVPATIMSYFVINDGKIAKAESITVRYGGWLMVIGFIATIITAVSFHNFLHLPPAMGMMLGLSYLMIIAYFVKKSPRCKRKFDVFDRVAGAEWDTLLFFFGIILSVGGLGLMGYLSLLSGTLYDTLGATQANIILGVISAIIDNIPVMFAVLTMQPEMNLNQWLLITLTTGVGGSLLSIGSAAGVALMGASKGKYTFMSHLRWMPVISLGYGASIYAHLLINGS